MFAIKVRNITCNSTKLPLSWKCGKVILANTCLCKQEKEKRKAWQAQVDRGITPEKAQEEYVELVEELKAKLGVKEAAA